MRILPFTSRGSKAARALRTGTVTLLFSDIEGSTRLLKTLGDGYRELLDDHRRLLRRAFVAHGGLELDATGDSFVVAFARAGDAVDAAVEAQRLLAAHRWPDGVDCRVRMGLHSGEAAAAEDGHYGMVFHRCARIAAAATGGQVLLSSVVAELVRDCLPPGILVHGLGYRRLRDIDHPEHLHVLVERAAPSPVAAPRVHRSAGRGCVKRRRITGPPRPLFLASVAIGGQAETRRAP